MFNKNTALNLLTNELPKKNAKQTKEHIDNYYSNIENIMRKNNVGFFHSDILSGQPGGAKAHHTSQQPWVNETNYNVHVKNDHGIVNINLINNSADGAMFSGPFPKSQGYANADDTESEKHRDMKKTSHSTTVNRNRFRILRKPAHQDSITLTNQPRRK